VAMFVKEIDFFDKSSGIDRLSSPIRFT